MAEQVTFLSTKRKGKLMSHNGYIYRISKKKDSKSYWKCNNGCRATVVLVNDKYDFSSGKHNHLPDEALVVAKQKKDELKARVENDNLTPIPQIYKEVVGNSKSNSEEITARLPSYSNVRHCMYNIRNKNIKPQVPGVSREIQLPGVWKLSTNGDNFLLCNEGFEHQIQVSGKLAKNQQINQQQPAQDSGKLVSNQQTNQHQPTQVPGKLNNNQQKNQQQPETEFFRQFAPQYCTWS